MDKTGSVNDATSGVSHEITRIALNDTLVDTLVASGGGIESGFFPVGRGISAALPECALVTLATEVTLFAFFADGGF